MSYKNKCDDAAIQVFPELNDNNNEILNGNNDETIGKSLLNFLDEFSKLGINTNFDKWTKSDCADWICWVEKHNENINYEILQTLSYQEGLNDGIKIGKQQKI